MTHLAADAPKTLPEVARAFVSHGSPRILLILAPLTVALKVADGRWSLGDLAVAAAVIAGWPLLEWVLHVFVLHFRPLPIGPRRVDPWVSQKHRAHHADPWNPPLIFIPLHTYVLTAPLVCGLWLGVAPPGLGWTGLMVTTLMTLHYEWVHHLAHTRYRPRTRLYRGMWKHHRLHHMKNEQYWFGVTTRSGDRWLGTDGEPDRVPTSQTCRTLF